MESLANGANIVFWGVVTFSILVVLHEGGHFLAARLFGVKVHEFMVGLPGPALRYRSRRSGTAFGVTMIPLGGYVRIAGMEPGPENPLLGPVLAAVTRERRTNTLLLAEQIGEPASAIEDALHTLVDWGAIAYSTENDDEFVALMDASLVEDPEALLARARGITYRGLSTFKRVVLLSAGVFVNLATAILVFVIVISAFGYYQPSLVVDKAMPNSAAADAGIVKGDRLSAVDGEKVASWQEFTEVISTREPGDEVVIAYVRNGDERSVTAVLGQQEGGQAYFGVQASVEHVKPNVLQAIRESFMWTGMVFSAVADFFRPSTFRESLGGAMSVVGISVEVARVVRSGALDYAWLVAFLSLSLGVMNILPIPPLDGGKIVIELIQRVVGRPLPRRVSYALSAIGTLLLFTLVGYLIYADIMRLTAGGVSG